MQTRSSAPYRRIDNDQRHRTSWLGALVAVAFATMPLVVMLWVVPVTGIGIA